jgi:hypothetical protein
MSGDIGRLALFIKTFMCRNMFARFSKDIINTHVLARIIGRMIMDMDMSYIWNRFVKQGFDLGSNLIPCLTVKEPLIPIVKLTTR